MVSGIRSCRVATSATLLPSESQRIVWARCLSRQSFACLARKNESFSLFYTIVRTSKNQYNTDMSYPIHFRKKILAKLEEGQSIRAVAQHFEIDKNTIVEWKKRIEIKRTRPRKPSKVDDDALRADVEQYPDDYQYERAARFGCGTSTIGDALKRLNITVKKRPYGTRKQKQNSESSI